MTEKHVRFVQYFLMFLTLDYFYLIIDIALIAKTTLRNKYVNLWQILKKKKDSRRASGSNQSSEFHRLKPHKHGNGNL